jgi:TetR/AcrR family transcriptional regulator, transcriptional repressor for nem operon
VADMQRAPTGRRALDCFFARVVDDCVSADPVRRHCIVSVGLLEGIDDSGVQRALRGAWRDTRDLLRGAITRGQQDGSVRSDLSSDLLADHLMLAMSGLRVAARAGTPAARQREAIALALALLDPDRPPDR